MPVAAAARFVGITTSGCGRVLQHYVARAVGAARSRLGARRRPGRDGLQARPQLRHRVHRHGPRRQAGDLGDAGQGKPAWRHSAPSCSAIAASRPASPRSSATCRRPPAALATSFPKAAITVDWFHVVQIFTTAVDQVRKAEARSRQLPKAIRWAVLRAGDGALTYDQRIALAELETGGFATAAAYRAKEMLRWIRHADTRKPPAGASLASSTTSNRPRPYRDALDPVRPRARTVATHTEGASSSGGSHPTPTARREGLNGIFPGRTSPRPRIPKHRNLYHHHLPARGATPDILNPFEASRSRS